MAYNERYEEIIKILTKLKKVSVQVLTERLKVSEVTIRKDLSFLESQGKLVRTHGGAVLAEDAEKHSPLSRRKLESLDQKKSIAKVAREFIKEDDTIYIDSGSTCLQLIHEIRDMSLHVLTNSLDVMIELANYPQISLCTLGGTLRTEARSFIGPIAVSALSNFQIQTCFIGASGISLNGIFSSQNMIEAQFKKAVIESSQRRIILSDITKIGNSAFSIFAKADDIDVLITDRSFDGIDTLRNSGIEVVVAGQ
ncbi:MAG: DeoR/GlpR transcriptional regulator [Spirochaetales bacterium]|nr:DeoR/GlpR transcriptional regulator [Spirochaetales bacterium]